MPTYEYQCDACNHQFEIEQRITENKLKKCPECKKMKLVRLVGTGNFILKGGGWYADLYSSAPPSKKSGSDESSSSGSESSGSGASASDSSSSDSSKKSGEKKSKKGDKKAS